MRDIACVYSVPVLLLTDSGIIFCTDSGENVSFEPRKQTTKIAHNNPKIIIYFYNAQHDIFIR